MNAFNSTDPINKSMQKLIIIEVQTETLFRGEKVRGET